MSIFKIFFCGAAHALRFVQTEETIVELADYALCGEKIVEQPLLTQAPKLCTENGCRVWSKLCWLVDCNQDVLQL